MQPTITLTSDFGLRDSYVAEMKAVILGISPTANIIDISHDIEKFDIRMAAYTLACAAPYFPKGTVHVAVVDPGVGTRRRPLLMQTQSAFYIGPDNGILALVTGDKGIEHIFEITNPKLMLARTSNTFHGRDIFAPAAAHLANGTQPKEFGPEITKISTPKFARIIRKRNMLTGEVLHIDGFGNIITNFLQEDLDSMGIKETVNIKIKNHKLKLKLGKAYADVKKKETVALFGSHGFLELSVNQGNAGTAFKTKTGDKITLSKLEP
jgi:S-adenosylmethionine hydrolase